MSEGEESLAGPFDSILMLEGDPAFPVLPNMRIGRALSMTAFKGGKGIEDDEESEGPLFRVDSDTHEVFSAAVGMMRLHDGHFSIEPITKISSDALRVTTVVFPRDYAGTPMRAAIYAQALKMTGAQLPLDVERVKITLAKAKETGEALSGVVLCAGKAPVHGQDGRLEKLHGERLNIGTESEDGSINYRDRGAHPTVESGNPVAMYHQPTEGEDGLDVYRKVIPAEGGAGLNIETGENIVANTLADGNVVYEATADGLVDVQGNKVAVSTVLQLPGDVDMNTGNIILETGSVHVHGTIQSGFSVSVPEHLIVDEVIESSMVTCGGDLQVNGGITMEGRNIVEASGGITAAYTQDAIIQAGGDVVINGGITNSFITTKGKIMALTGKGTVHGGALVSGKGIELLQAGSEMGVQTELAVRLDIPELDELATERESLQGDLMRIEQWIGGGTTRAILLQTPEPDRLLVAELLRVRGRMQERASEVQEDMARITALNNADLAEAPITVRDSVYPGVRIKMGKKTLSIREEKKAVRFVWNISERCIDVVDIV